MSVDIRKMCGDDVHALRDFFAEVPPEDRTFFKEDITIPGMAERWCADFRSFRMLAVDDDGRVLAFAALVPGVHRTNHVADLRLVVAASARGHGLGRAVARRMLVAAVEQDFKKVTVELAADMTAPIDMFRSLGFEPEALLRDQLRDPDGELHDLVILAHRVDDTWAAMLTAGIDAEVS